MEDENAAGTTWALGLTPLLLLLLKLEPERARLQTFHRVRTVQVELESESSESSMSLSYVIVVVCEWVWVLGIGIIVGIVVRPWRWNHLRTTWPPSFGESLVEHHHRGRSGGRGGGGGRVTQRRNAAAVGLARHRFRMGEPTLTHPYGERRVHVLMLTGQAQVIWMLLLFGVLRSIRGGNVERWGNLERSARARFLGSLL